MYFDQVAFGLNRNVNDLMEQMLNHDTTLSIDMGIQNDDQCIGLYNISR